MGGGNYKERWFSLVVAFLAVFASKLSHPFNSVSISLMSQKEAAFHRHYSHPLLASTFSIPLNQKTSLRN